MAVQALEVTKMFLANRVHSVGLDTIFISFEFACLVENSARHTKHSDGMEKPPVLGKDACARKGEHGIVCRYGFPKTDNKFPRGAERKMRLKKVEGREGCWEACFPRNDALVCSHEAHVPLLSNSSIA